MFVFLWLTWLMVMTFILGSMVGSFLNVCIARLPEGKSLVFPGSRCGFCSTPIRLRDNLPLLSYWLLRGRCRSCGAPFSMRYFWVELTTGLAFLAVLVLEVGLNIHRYSSFSPRGFWYLEGGNVPPHFWPFILGRLLMFCLLLVAFCCSLERQCVPRSVLYTGLLAATALAVFFPWPWPRQTPGAGLESGFEFQTRLEMAALFRLGGHWMDSIKDWGNLFCPQAGMQLWPVWGPLPAWLPVGSWRLGLATALAGALAGGFLTVLLHCGLRTGMGRGKGDIVFLLLAGAFLGWQPIVVAVLGGSLLAALLAGPLLVFGVSLLSNLTFCLAVGVVGAWFGWPWLGPMLAPILFDAEQLSGLIFVLLVVLPLLALWLRWLQPPAGQAS